MIKQKIAVLLLFVALAFGLSGCINEKSSSNVTKNYNQYIYQHGTFACTEEAYLFFEGGSLFFLDSELSAPLSRLCVRPNCQHTDQNCSSVINAHSIFASGNHIYYLDQDDQGLYGVYEIDMSTQKRKCIKEIPELTEGMGYSQRIYDSYLVLEIMKWEEDSQKSMIWLTDITDPSSEMEVIFGGEDNTEIVYTSPEIKEDWIFVGAYREGEEDGTLMGYHLKSGKTYQLVKNWVSSNRIALRDDRLYYYGIEDGFHSISLDTMELTTYRLSEPYEYGPSGYDDRYLYLTNTLPPLDQMELIESEQRGIYIYDYEGKLMQYIPTTDLGIYPVYCMSSPEHVLFYDFAQGNFPKWYIEKEKIETGTAELIALE